MKISIQRTIRAFALASLTFCSANADDKEAKKPTAFKTGIYCSITGKINMYVDRISPITPAVILLTSETGQVFYKEIIKNKNRKFGRALNVDQLEQGKYQLKLIMNGETLTKSFLLTDQKKERILTIE
jgi:hypothetical protein